MRNSLLFAALLGFSAPAMADDPVATQVSPENEVKAAVNAFFAALRDPDKTALSRSMAHEGVIFVHDRRNPDNVLIQTVPVANHLENWLRSPEGTDEYMVQQNVLIDGSMAHVWGPYVFLIDGEPTHCGINSMSLVHSENGWLVGNTSFTMTALNECEPLGAPEVAQ